MLDIVATEANWKMHHVPTTLGALLVGFIGLTTNTPSSFARRSSITGNVRNYEIHVRYLTRGSKEFLAIKIRRILHALMGNMERPL